MPLPLIIIAAAAAAQSPQNVGHRPDDGERLGRAFLSPMGEPVFGRTPGEEGLIVWFQQVDRNHDGVITVDEMEADADRFFNVLDTNHDGQIDPDEVAHYETVIAPEVRTRAIEMTRSENGSSQDNSRQGRHGGGGGHRGGRSGGASRQSNDFGAGFGSDDEAGAGRYGLLQIPEPVASADSNFDRTVSREEFREAAISRFRLLDIDHTGRLTLPELQNIRRAAEAEARHPTQSTSNQDSDVPHD